MISSDPIADMLSRIRNALAVRKNSVSVPHSKAKEALAKLLAENNYLKGVSVVGEGTAKTIVLGLFDDGNNYRITEIKKLSTPGRRLYCSADKIPVVRRGRGMIFISTNQGVMTGAQALEKRLGGELICRIY